MPLARLKNWTSSMKKITLNLAIFLLACLFLTSPAFANDPEEPGLPSIFLKRTTANIVIDGELNENAWFSGRPADNFWEYFPVDTVHSSYNTEVYMTYDDNFLYIGARCESIGDEFIVPSLKRDYRAGGNDNITFLIDPFNDRLNAFVFGINPYGVIREALISNGGTQIQRDWSSSWENKWKGEAKIHDTYWTCEMAIPFTSLRFNAGEKKWRFNCYRFDTQTNTRNVWQQIPQNQLIINLAYMGEMIWDEPLETSGGSISVIPYVTGSVNKDYEENLDADWGGGFGGDVKWSVTSGLNLDLTFNPDFSQVEVDRQVLNLDRFEIFFPERRQFFLENADLFGSFGNQRINPFFSRRIGIASVYERVDADDVELPDSVDPDNLPFSEDRTTISNAILAGARLSGKINRNWRLGLLNMQTAAEPEFGLPSYNFSVVALQRRMFSRSNLSFIFANKQTFDGDNSVQQFDDETGAVNDNVELYSPFNRVVGVDYNLASKDNTWFGKFFYHQAITADEEFSAGEKFAHGAVISKIKRRFSVQWEHQLVRPGFDPEVGFVPRKDFFQIRPEARLFFYPKGKFLNQHGPGVRTNFLWTPGIGKTDHEIEVFWEGQLTDNGRINVSINNQYTFLLDPFDPSRSDSKELPAETGYSYTSFQGEFRSDRRRVVSYSLDPYIGQFFNGYRYGTGFGILYRFQPYGFIELRGNYSYIDLPDGFAQTSLWLIGPRIDLTFSKDVFLTTFLQYNNQTENFNINTRLQWRFAPVSDFFLVYTDNYDANVLGIKNRAVVAKLTYWLNI